jgi:hypothetical protein
MRSNTLALHKAEWTVLALRMPDQLKTRAEQAAANDRASLNAWLVKAVTAALDRAGPPRRDGSTPPSRRQRYVGWGR